MDVEIESVKIMVDNRSAIMLSKTFDPKLQLITTKPNTLIHATILYEIELKMERSSLSM